MTIIETLLLSLFAVMDPPVPPAQQAPPATTSQSNAAKPAATEDDTTHQKGIPPKSSYSMTIHQISNGY